MGKSRLWEVLVGVVYLLLWSSLRQSGASVPPIGLRLGWQGLLANERTYGGKGKAKRTNVHTLSLGWLCWRAGMLHKRTES
jgi:hypothetical protein